jgi:hypothetical protein
MAGSLLYFEKVESEDVMVDIETLATSDTAVILSIGAIRFNPFTLDPLFDEEKGEVLCPSFYKVIHRETQKGRTIDKSTEEWWDHPDRAEAKLQIVNAPDKVHLVEALDGLWDFMKGIPANGHKKTGKGWGCAPSFDQSILGNAMEMYGVNKLKGNRNALPIPFWDEMDVRTIETFVFGRKHRAELRKGTYHNALHDCITQAVMVREAAAIVAAGREALTPKNGNKS